MLGGGTVGAEDCGGSESRLTKGISNWDSFLFEMRKDDFELLTLLSPLPKCLDSRHVTTPGTPVLSML